MGGSQQSKIKESPLFVDTSGWPDGRKTSKMTVDRFRSADPHECSSWPECPSVQDAPARVSNRFTLRAVLKEDKRLDSPSGSSEWSGGTSSADISPQSPPASVRSIRTSASTVSQFSWTRASAADRPPLYRNAEGEFYVAFHGERFVFSNDYECPCGVACNGNLFPTALHYFVYQKALSCGNKSIAERVVVEREVEKARELLVKLRASNQENSNKTEVMIMRQACLAKFEQNPSLRTELFRTGTATLVSASADLRWGVGIEADDPDVANPAKWRGSNLFGQCLMAARAALAAQHPEEFAQEKEIAERRQKRAEPCA